MSCSDKFQTIPTKALWSNKTTSWFFQPMGSPEETTDIKTVRTSIENRRSTGAVKTRAAYRLSNDGNTWDTPVPVYTDGQKEQTNDGITYGDSFVTVTGGDGKLYVQWGVQIANTTGTGTEIVEVTLKVDRRS